MNISVLLLHLNIIIWSFSHARRDGTPVCEFIPRGHGTEQAGSKVLQIGAKMSDFPPFTYIAGSSLRVTLNTSDGRLFRGLHVRAEDSTGRPIGYFVVPADDAVVRASPCLPFGVAVTHRDNKDKDMIDLEWKAPQQPNGLITIRATAVESFGAPYHISLETLALIELNEAPKEPWPPMQHRANASSLWLNVPLGLNRGPPVTDIEVQLLQADSNSSRSVLINVGALFTESVTVLVEGLASGSSFGVRARALNSVGWGEFSSEAHVRTTKISSTAPVLSSSSGSSSSAERHSAIGVKFDSTGTIVELEWDNAFHNGGEAITSYRVIFSSREGPAMDESDKFVNSGETSLRIPGLLPEARYIVSVYATNLVGESSEAARLEFEAPSRVSIRVGRGDEIIRSKVCALKGRACIEWALDPQNDRVELTLSAMTTGWVGLNLGAEDGMSGADTIVAWIDDDSGSPQTENRHSDAIGVTPSLDSPTGEMTELQDSNATAASWLHVIRGTQNSTHTSVTVLRPLALPQSSYEGIVGKPSYDTAIVPGLMHVGIAYGVIDEFEMHSRDARAKLRVNFFGEGDSYVIDDLGNPMWVYVHAVLMMLGFGVLLPAAAIVVVAARAKDEGRAEVPNVEERADEFFKRLPREWFVAHRGLALGGACCVVLGGAIAVVGRSPKTLTSSHVGTGYVLLGCIVVQVMLGLAAHSELAHTAHRWLGRVLLVVAVLYQVRSGIEVSGWDGDRASQSSAAISISTAWMGWLCFVMIIAFKFLVHLYGSRLARDTKTSVKLTRSGAEVTRLALEEFYAGIGRVCAMQSWRVVFTTLGLSMLASAGLLRLPELVDSSIVRSFVPQNTRVLLSQDKYLNIFDDEDSEGSGNTVLFTLVATSESSIGGGSGTNLLTVEVLEEVYRMQVHLETMVVPAILPNGTVANATLDAICRRAYPSASCFVASPLDWWRSNLATVRADHSLLETVASRNESFSDALGMTKRRATIFGALEWDEQSTTHSSGFAQSVLKSVRAMRIAYPIQPSRDPTHIALSSAWQQHALDVGFAWSELRRNGGVHDSGDLPSSFKVHPLAGISGNAEINRVIAGDVMFFGLCIFAMVLFSAVQIGDPFPTTSRILLAVGGVFSVCLAILSGFGVACWFGYKFSVLHAMLPFVIIGIGLDDMYILVDSVKGLDVITHSTVEILDTALRTSGPAITMTTATDFVAFLCGSFSPLPAIASFSFYAACSVLFDLVLQSTFFVALFAMDLRRTKRGQADLVPCCLTSRPNNEENEGEMEPKFRSSKQQKSGRSLIILLQQMTSFVPHLLYRRILPSVVGRSIILLLAAIMVSISAWQATMLESGQDYRTVLPDDSYVHAVLDASNTFFNEGRELNSVVLATLDGNIDYSSLEVQAKLLVLSDACADVSLRVPGIISVIRESGWLDRFLEWAVKTADSESLVLYTYHGPLPFHDVQDDIRALRWPRKLINPPKFYTLLVDWLSLPILGDVMRTQFLKFNRPWEDCVSISQNGGTFDCRLTATRTMIDLPVEVDVVAEKEGHAQRLLVCAYVDALHEALDVVSLPGTTATSGAFIIGELNSYAPRAIYAALGLALLAVGIVGLLFLGNVRVVALVTVQILCLNIETLGVMRALGIKLDAVAIVMLVMSIGLSFDYIAHVAHSFIHMPDEGGNGHVQLGRVQRAMMSRGLAVFRGAFSTILGVFFLVGAGSAVFRTMFACFFTIVSLSIVHGFIILPTMLVLVGSKYQKEPKAVVTMRRKSTFKLALVKEAADVKRAQSKGRRSVVVHEACTARVHPGSTTGNVIEPSSGITDASVVTKHETYRYCKACFELMYLAIYVFIGLLLCVVVTVDLNKPTSFVQEGTVAEVKDVIGYGHVATDTDVVAKAFGNNSELVLLIGSFEVPSKKTTYACRGFELPVDAARHLIRYSPILPDPDEEIERSLVHHFVLFNCWVPTPDTAHECGTMPDGCVEIVGTWAVGGQAFDYPPEAGVLVGRGTDTVYVTLQVHYDNPSEVKGVIDNSGLAVTLTPNLRTYNAGVLTLGARFEAVEIPPRQPAKCPPRATKRCPSCSPSHLDEFFGDNSNNVTIISSLLHAHILARRVWTEQYRDGELVGTIGANAAFDFNLQVIESFEAPSKILRKGDVLVTTCQFDSTQRSSRTFGGDATDQEMCLNFLAYYPKSAATEKDPYIGVCLSDAVEAFTGAAPFPEFGTKDILDKPPK